MLGRKSLRNRQSIRPPGNRQQQAQRRQREEQLARELTQLGTRGASSAGDTGDTPRVTPYVRAPEPPPRKGGG